MNILAPLRDNPSRGISYQPFGGSITNPRTEHHQPPDGASPTPGRSNTNPRPFFRKLVFLFFPYTFPQRFLLMQHHISLNYPFNCAVVGDPPDRPNLYSQHNYGDQYAIMGKSKELHCCIGPEWNSLQVLTVITQPRQEHRMG